MPVSISGAGSISGLDQGFNVTTGSVGVGTTNPRTDLQVGAFGGGDSNIQLATGTSGASNILFGDDSAGSDYYKGFIKYNHSTDNLELYTTDDLIHYTGGTERLRITSDGGVGIGTDIPYVNNSFNSLSIGGSGKYGLIELNKSDGVAGSWIDVYGTNGNGDLRITTAGTSGAITFWTGGSFTEKLRITSAGNVGIGTDNPDATLKVNVASGNNGVVVQNNSTGNIALFGARNGDATIQVGQFGSTAGATTFGLSNANLAFIYTTSYSTTHPSALALGTVSNKPLVFATNNTERLRITSGGDVLIADTTNSIYDDNSGGGMNLKANGQLVLKKQAVSTADPLMWLNDTGQTTNKFILFAQDGNEKASIGLAGNDLRFARDGYNETLRITSAGKIGINQSSPAGQVHIKGNTDESANPSIILDDNGDSRRCYVTNSSGDLMLGGIDSGTVQSRLTIHENGNMYHQRLNSSGSLVYQFQTGTSQTGGAASGNTYTEHMAFRQADGMKHGSFTMTIYGDGGDNYMPVLFIRHGYHPTNSSFGGQWFGEMWLNNAGSINPQSYNHTGYNNWATCSFKYRWDCAHWNAKPTLNMIEHYVNYGRTNIADLEISGTTSYFVMWLLPGTYRVTYSAWDGLNAWWTNNNNVGGPLTHREGGGNTTRAVRAYSARDTRYDSNISWGTQGQT